MKRVTKIKQRIMAMVCVAAMMVGTAFVQNVSAGAQTQTNSSTGLPVMGLEVHAFAVSQNSSGNNAALNWATDGISGDITYAVYRSVDGKAYEKCYVTNGTSWQDYDLSDGHSYRYKVAALNTDGSENAVSNEATFSPVARTNNMKTHSNEKGGELSSPTSGTKIGDTYYSYSMKNNNGSYYLVESTSKDGVNFNSQRTVADKSQNQDLGNCKLESVQMKYIEHKNLMIIWAHWELPSGYNSGKALVITGTPGGSFKVHRIYNPLGVYVRDMTIFLDDDDTAYLIAASNEKGQSANATMYIFQMNDTYSDVTRVVKKLHENQFREFPSMVKRDGYYYLFTSQTAGWYPSQGGYTVTKDLSGQWSELRSIGNTSTFSSQSGWVQSIGNGDNCVMHAYRWVKSSDTAGSTLCPLYFANGFAFYDYCTAFGYDMQSGDLLPVQDGKLLSLNKPVTSSIKGTNLSSVVDGSYTSAFTGTQKTWPFNIQIDLLKESDLSNIQISWYMCKGSEGYYTYYVDGSNDGKNWSRLLDRTNESSDRVTKTYGFTSDELNGRARYIRLTVTNAHLHNNPNNNWYSPKIYEIKVFGQQGNASTSQPKDQPAAVYHMDKTELSGNAVSDKTGRNGNLVLHGNYRTTGADNNAEQTKYFGESKEPLYFDGSSNCYAELPAGLLKGTDAFSISLRARSEMDFSSPYFTLGLGNDQTHYLIFKLGKDAVRFQMTNNSWMGETGIKQNVDGSNWHTYTMTVDGTTAKLYVDGTLAGENYTMGALLSDFGDQAKLYLGKSFYGSDQYFKGAISSVSFYDYALSAKNVADMKNTVYAKDNSTSGDTSGGTTGGTTGGGSGEATDGTRNLWNGSWDLKQWSNALEIDKNLSGVQSGTLKISYNCNSGAQLQLACIDKNGNWVQLVDYVDISGSAYIYDLGSKDLALLQTAQKIVIKGQNAVVTSVDVSGKMAGSGSTDSGNTGSGSTDTGNTGSGSTDSGNTGSGSTDSGNTGSGSTDSGNTGSVADMELITDQTNGIMIDDGTWNWKEKNVTFKAPAAGKYRITLVAQSGDANAWMKVACNGQSLWEEGHWCDGNWTSVTKTATVSLNAGENTILFGGNMKVKYVSCIVSKIQ